MVKNVSTVNVESLAVDYISRKPITQKKPKIDFFQLSTVEACLKT